MNLPTQSQFEAFYQHWHQLMRCPSDVVCEIGYPSDDPHAWAEWVGIGHKKLVLHRGNGHQTDLGDDDGAVLIAMTAFTNQPHIPEGMRKFYAERVLAFVLLQLEADLQRKAQSLRIYEGNELPTDAVLKNPRVVNPTLWDRFMSKKQRSQ